MFERASNRRILVVGLILPALFIGYDFLVIALAYSGLTARLPNSVWLMTTLLTWAALFGFSGAVAQRFRTRIAWTHMVIVVSVWFVCQQRGDP